jgi:hypothetical protein
LDRSPDRFAVLVLVLAALPATIAGAGTAIRLDVAGLVDRADLAIEGRVVTERACLGPAKRIDTEYTIAVERTFCGEHAPTRVVRLPGGVLPDGRGMIVPGIAKLSTGASVLLFLTPADACGMRMPVGLAQGELAVVADTSGAKHIVRDPALLTLVDARTGTTSEAGSKIFLDYAATIAEIEARAAAKRARARGEGVRDASDAIPRARTEKR